MMLAAVVYVSRNYGGEVSGMDYTSSIHEHFTKPLYVRLKQVYLLLGAAPYSHVS
jgi:hypothetical protein